MKIESPAFNLDDVKAFMDTYLDRERNILADRLQKLVGVGIIVATPDVKDARRVNYRLTRKGIDLAPVVLELLIWGARYEDTGAPCAMISNLEKHREALLAEVRRRWRRRDSTPLQAKSGQWLWP